MPNARRSTRRQRQLRADTIIVGFTGSLGSGCSFIAQGVARVLGSNGAYYRASDVLRDLAGKKGMTGPTTSQLQDLGNELRSKKGGSAVVEECLKRIQENIRAEEFVQTDDTVVLIDGIRNDAEVRCLRQFSNFYLLSVHAEAEVRERRLVGSTAPDRRFESRKSFEEADARDRHEAQAWGQQVHKCNYLADVIIQNSQPFAKAHKRRRNEYFNKLVNDYIESMRAVRKGERRFDRPPGVDEALMTMAYCVSKRSSCLKRKVGAVIAHIPAVGADGDQASPADSDLRFQVVSSGYNDVPLGTKPCVFADYGKCYRDHLQESHAKDLNYCPRCGREIPKRPTLPPSEYVCECGCEVFESYLPGGRATPGKLLDMCRALHAEENAILGLSGISKQGKGELVLYSTTFPCNLCANKIVAAGITRVVFAEPYPMEESKKVLDAGGVDVREFEGVKSTAYFRFYS